MGLTFALRIDRCIVYTCLTYKKIPYFGTLFIIRLIQDSSFLRVRFRQASLYMVLSSFKFILNAYINLINQSNFISKNILAMEMKPYNLFALNIVEILLKLTVNTNQSAFSNHYVKPIFLGFPPINHVQFASTLICFFREFIIYLCYLYIFTHTVVQHTFNLR